ncbi:uncharacterized protein LOC129911059 [Episyrphus balteatus]|uniref:uncharacterized protein LOC129911059 n=1 Tax=Episyrphus balteatus TaxID=286459 RepID=UPI002485B779|nr:uncharacterized protein LOC129911059 [Episyrphus balteatus]
MDKQCFLCKSKAKDEVKFGEFMTRGKISVHYFCLLLSSNLMQNGRDDEGLLGFMPKDIQEEANRVKPLMCYYCKKPSANISCCASKCYKSFHLTCGEKNSTEHNFVGTFKSFCHHHVKGKKVTPPLPDEKCCICYDYILGQGKKFDTVNMIRAPCCKNGWFHKYCLAAFAKTAGYFFKCPLCNDSKLFRQRLAYKSIFIPDRDAAWELEPNAYAELLERPSSCSAENCRSEGGRESKTKRNEFVFCSTCGSVAIHRRCMKTQTKNFLCNECTSFTAAINNSSVVNISATQQSNHNDEEDENEEIDVCDDLEDGPLNNSETTNELEEDKEEETIKPLGLGVKNNKLVDNGDSSDGESDNSSNEGTDIDVDDIIQPLGIIKPEKYKIVDYNVLESELEEEVISNRKTLKRTNRIISSDSSDIQTTSCKRQKRLPSSETESLFDSGAESDRSGSSGYKCNSKSSLENSTSDFSQKSDQKEVVYVKRLKNLEIEQRCNRRFTSLNDGINKTKTKIKPKRCVSDYKDTFSNLSEYETDGFLNTVAYERTIELKIERLFNEEQTSQPVLQKHVSFSNQENKNSSFNNPASSEMVEDLKSKSAITKISPMRLRSRSEDYEKEQSSPLVHQKHDSFSYKESKTMPSNNSVSSEMADSVKPISPITEISPMRLRSQSEDFSKRAPRISRRRSCNPSSLQTITEPYGLKRLNESLDSGSSKRSCLDSITDNERCTLTQNNNTTSVYKDENNYKKSIGLKNHRSRGRSPLMANITDVYAYMTPPYIKQLKDKFDKTKTADDIIELQSSVTEDGKAFVKNKPNHSKRSNFSQSSNSEQSNQEDNANLSVEEKANQNGTATDRNLNGFDNLFGADKSKIKKNKTKRIPSQKSPKGITSLPSNQTKIESFFKRV